MPKEDPNWDTIEKHAGYYRDAKRGIYHHKELTPKEKKAIEDAYYANLWRA